MPKDPPANPRSRRLVHRLFTHNTESLQDTTSTGLEDAPETVPALAHTSSVRQTLPDTRSSRPRTSTAHAQAEEISASMVPPDNATARSRSRILRLNNIQRSRWNRRPNNSRLYDRDQSSLNDGAAGKPCLNHSLTCEPEQFCGKRQPELFSLPRNHKRHHRPEPWI